MFFSRRRIVPAAVAAALFAFASFSAGDASADTFRGINRLARNGANEEVSVKREVGASAGYEDKLQAVAVARMGNLAHAVIVKTTDGKWHTLETTASYYSPGPWANHSGIREMVGLAPLSMMPRVSLEQMTQEQIAIVLGVTPGEVNPIAWSSSRKAGVVNVTANLGEAGQHGVVGTSADGDFAVGAATAIEIKRDQLADSRKAAAVLFHEVTHRLDYAQAQYWAGQYPVIGEFSSSDYPVFAGWVMKSDRRGLARDDAYTIATLVQKNNGPTEARAYTATFLAALQAGAPEVARDQLDTYAYALTNGKAADPGSEIVKSAVRADLENAYRAMNAEQRSQFDAAFKQLAKRSPRAWIASFDHKTALKK